MNHIAWAPEEWLDAALTTLSGLSERHPSRTILLVPSPSAADGVESEVRLENFRPGEPRTGGVLRGDHAPARREPRQGGGEPGAALASAEPSGIPPLAWTAAVRGAGVREPRGRRRPARDRLERVAGPARGLCAARLLLRAVAVSDIAWARTEGWRLALADRWPGITDLSDLSVRGPTCRCAPPRRLAQGAARPAVRLQHDAAPTIERPWPRTTSMSRFPSWAKTRLRASSSRASSTAWHETRSTSRPPGRGRCRRPKIDERPSSAT